MIKISILKNPFTIIFSILLGIFLGVCFKEFSLKIGILGKIYLSLLKMCVIPIFLTAIITSIAKLFRAKDAQKYIKKILMVFLIFFFVTGVICIAAEVIGEPGRNLDHSAKITLGKLLNNADNADKVLKENVGLDDKQGISEFIKDMIPENIFNALSHGHSLQILFFAIIFGIAAGLSDSKYNELIISFTEAFFKIFFNIIDWTIYLLPFALVCLLSSQIAGTGVEILFAMLKFIISIYVVSIILVVLNGFIIKFYTGFSIIDSFLKMKECLLIAFGTQSTFASIPACIEGLTEGLKLNKELINLVIPIGAVMCRFSMVILYSAATVFTAQLYDISLGVHAYIICLVLSIVAAVAGAGTPGIVSISMITIVLVPLKLPAEAIIVLLLSVNPLIEPVTTMTNVHSNCAAASIIAGRI